MTYSPEYAKEREEWLPVMAEVYRYRISEAVGRLRETNDPPPLKYLTGSTLQLMASLERISIRFVDGHLAILHLGDKWKVGFGPVYDEYGIAALPEGDTFEDAALKAMKPFLDAYDHEFMEG